MVGPIDQGPEQREEFGPALNLVDDDEPPEIHEGQLGITEPVQIRRILEVEVVDGRQIRSPLGDIGSCQGRLPALTGAQQGHGRSDLEGASDLLDELRAFHAKEDIMKYLR